MIARGKVRNNACTPLSGYRIWYRTYGPGPPNCYATSMDGIHWTKPVLGIVSYGGSTANDMYTTLGRVNSVMHTPFNTNF